METINLESPAVLPTFGRPSDRPPDRPTDGPIVRSISRQTDRQTAKSTIRPPDRSTVRPTDRQTDRPNDRPTNQPTFLVLSLYCRSCHQTNDLFSCRQRSTAQALDIKSRESVSRDAIWRTDAAPCQDFRITTRTTRSPVSPDDRSTYCVIHGIYSVLDVTLGAFRSSYERADPGKGRKYGRAARLDKLTVGGEADGHQLRQ